MLSHPRIIDGSLQHYPNGVGQGVMKRCRCHCLPRDVCIPEMANL